LTRHHFQKNAMGRRTAENKPLKIFKRFCSFGRFSLSGTQRTFTTKWMRPAGRTKQKSRHF
jgi:hypothetical protein